MRKELKEKPILVGISILLFALYAIFSLFRHWKFGSSGFDLGIFDQTVWQYSRFNLPVNTVRGFDNILGDHFSPILMLLAPLYWLFPRAETLLVAQAALIASSVVPVYLFSKKRFGQPVSYVFIISYGLYWGLLNAIAYDFHEIAFAVLLIAWIIYAIDTKKWRVYTALIIALLLVKENQALFVMACGLLLLWKKEYRYAAFSFIGGSLWFVAITKVVIPALSGKGTYGYWSYTQLGETPGQALRYILQKPSLVWDVAVHPSQKIALVTRLLRPFLSLALISPYVILLLPNLAERLLSSNPSYWVNNFHYSATIAPVMAMAAVDGLHRISRYVDKKWRDYLIWVLVSLWLVIALAYVPRSNIRPMFSKDWYNLSTAEISSGREALDVIPRGASVIAQDVIIPHLSSREHIYQLNVDIPESRNRKANYIIATSVRSAWPMQNYDQVEQYLDEKVQSREYEIVFHKDGWTVLKQQ